MKKFKIIFCYILLFMCSFYSVNAADELTDNSAIISSSVVIQTKTGTAPFDENDEAGNDSSEDNNIVRSFDQVTWTVENTLALNTQEASSFVGGKIYFEATLPSDVFDSETVKWDTDSMAWIEEYTISDDGLTISGYYQMDIQTVTIPGKQTLVFVAKVLGAKGGLSFKPTITVWLQGNSDEDKVQVEGLEEVYTSAAPSYNVYLVRNTTTERGTFDIDGEEVSGKMFGYMVGLQLYNESVEKGLKGIEYPEGDITFELDMTLYEGTEDVTSQITPILWNYNISQYYANGAKIAGRKMFGSSAYMYGPHYLFPSGILTSNRKQSIYNSGDVSITQDGSKLYVTIWDYSFDGTFPTTNMQTSETKYTANIGFFSAIYVQILIPDSDAYNSSNDYYFEVSDTNFSATSVSGTLVTEQVNTSDDKRSAQYIMLLPGDYSSLIYLYRRSGSTIGSMLHSSWNAGDSKVLRNQEVTIATLLAHSGEEGEIGSFNNLLKFDADCYEPVVLDDGRTYIRSSTEFEINMWYVTKSDGTNWVSQEEMNTTTVDQVLLYETLEDIPDEALCVGIYYESTYISDDLNNFRVYIPAVIKDSATIDQTYGITQTPVYYSYELDRDVYTATNANVSWPADSVYSPIKNYVKTEYDENGVQISGTHSGGSYNGQTALVLGANQEIEITTIDPDTGEEKINYDFGKNEYDVTYKINPYLTNTAIEESDIDDITVTITTSLPAGLTYVAGSSNIGEPEYTLNEDGTTTLVWTIYGCKVNEEIEEITFTAHLDEESENGDQYTVSATILADEEKVGTTKESQRTSSTGIQVINLASHRLYKTVETPVIERGGQIHYTLSYKNNTEYSVDDFQLLDILPYNGDSRDTSFNGTYTLATLIVTQEDESGTTISNDNLTILYTDDKSARSATSKDENLGDGWSTTYSNISLNTSATAFCIKGVVAPHAKITIDIYLNTSNNMSLDKYVNSATAQTNTQTEEITTSNAIAQVIKRKIEGTAWLDKNLNGIKDEDEQILSNTQMTLTDSSGSLVSDVYGNTIEAVYTDENGYYSFSDMPAGDYYVVVTPESIYDLTEKEVGTNEEINSKFNTDTYETDLITKLNSTDLPELTASYVNVGFVYKETKVVVSYVDIDTEEEIYDQVTIDGRIEDEYVTEDKIDEINENSDYNYILVKTTENTTGKMGEDTIYVVYYYQKVECQVVVLHVDEETLEEIADRDYLGGYQGDKYSTSEKDIEGYTYIASKAPENKDGVYTTDTIYVTYYYTREQTVVDTGDIIVWAMFVLFIACIAGVLYVLRKRKEESQ